MFERLQASLNRMTELLQFPQLEPDPTRMDWSLLQDDLDEVYRLASQELVGSCDALLQEVDAHDETMERARAAVADSLGDAAALLLAAGRRDAGEEVLGEAVRLAEGLGVAELLREGQANPRTYVRAIRAFWLLQQGNVDGARAVADTVRDAGPATTALMQRIVDAPAPISSAPSLGTINGIGFRVHGDRDRWDDGSYVATRFFSFLYIPLVPMDAYRIADAEDGQVYFLGKAPLGPIAKWWRRLAVVALVAAGITGLVANHVNSDSYRLGEALAAAQESEEAAGPGEQEAVLAQYEAILHEFPDGDPDQLAVVVEAFVRLSAAAVESPLTVDRLGDVDLVVKRWRAIPQTALGSGSATPMAAQLEAWAAELGDDTGPALRGQLRLLELAAEFAPEEERAVVVARQIEIRRGLAAQLRDEWPLESFRQYVTLGEDADAIAAAAEILESLPDAPSVWLEIEPSVRAWLTSAQGQHSELEARVSKTINNARSYVEDPTRAAMLRDREPTALATALASEPGDHEIAVAVADLKAAAGDMEGAVQTLTSLGKPGLLSSEALVALAGIYANGSREQDAITLLDTMLSSRLPTFEIARREYVSRLRAFEDEMIAKAQSGRLPADVERKLDGAPSSKQQEIFGQWLSEQIALNPALARMEERYTALAGIVPIAIQLGTVRLRLAQSKEGAERQALLDGAERAFLAIATEGEGLASYHQGLGQVYYRLGKVAEAEHEFETLLMNADGASKLMVSQTYRDLGMTDEARALAQEVYDGEDKEASMNAVIQLSLLAETMDDRAMWLRRGDPTRPFIRLGLAEVEADEAFNRGELEAADAAYASVAKQWLENRSDSAAFNNAAVATQSRFTCTGDVERLVEAEALIEKSRRLMPNSALLVGNLAGAVQTRRDAEFLAQWVGLGSLRTGGGGAGALVDALLGGPTAAELLPKYVRGAAVGKARQLWEQYRALAPAADSVRSVEVSELTRTRDVEGLRRVVAELEAEGEPEAVPYEPFDDEDRGKAITDTEQAVATSRAARTAVERRAKRPTLGAVWALEALTLNRLGLLRGDVAPLREAVAAQENAGAAWDRLGVRTLAAMLIDLAVFEAAAGNDALVAELEEHFQNESTSVVLLWILEQRAELAAAIQTRPETQRAATLLMGASDDEVASFAWLVGRAAGHAELTTRARARTALPLYKLGLRASALIDRTEGVRRLSAAVEAL